MRNNNNNFAGNFDTFHTTFSCDKLIFETTIQTTEYELMIHYLYLIIKNWNKC